MNSKGLQFLKGITGSVRFRTPIFSAFNKPAAKAQWKSYHHQNEAFALRGGIFKMGICLFCVTVQGVGSLAALSLGTIANELTKGRKSSFVAAAEVSS